MLRIKLTVLFVMLLNGMMFATTPQLGKDNIENIIHAMTLEEKVHMLMGLGDANWTNPKEGEKTVIIAGEAGRTWNIDRLGIPGTVLADGPAGLRIEPKPAGVKNTRYCTAFPTATALASTWNPDMVETVGKAMGNEVHEYGCDVLLAPAINIHRNPLCGRNFEYYSEDPLLAGKLGAAMVRGIQSNGVGTSVKHFAANNIETNRTTINAVISQRALREIYLKAFEIVVKEAKPWTVMSSYNLLNGFYTSENYSLITTILRDEWKFDGMVMSDWWGGADAVAQMNAGNDLLMPGCAQQEELLSALKNNTIDEKVIDRNLYRILSYILKTPRFKGFVASEKPDLKAHLHVARQAATEGMVLLRNEQNTLPLKKKLRVALFGKTSYRYIAGGTGSGEVNYEKTQTINEAFEAAGFKPSKVLTQIYKHAIDTIITASKNDNKKHVVDFHPELPIQKAVIEAQVKNTDVAIITIGRNAGEGADRTVSDFSLSDIEKALINDVSASYKAAGKKTIVILNIGGVISTSEWRENTDAILLAWQAGQDGANAIVDIIKGAVNPSGKLPMTFPIEYANVPSALTFPGEPANNPINAEYNEGIYVGYRYYNTFQVPTAYEFGFGLSYTKFEIKDLKVSSNVFDKELEVTVSIKNISKVPGKEVVQLYLSAPKEGIQKPEEELKAFAKTKLLKPGEIQEISFTLTADKFASFWTNRSAWIAQKGNYDIKVGTSSKDIKTIKTIQIANDIVIEKVNNVLYPNRKLNELSKK